MPRRIRTELPEGFSPSRPLADERHERFAQLIVRGKAQIDAHEAAGYARSSGNASTLRKNLLISARIEWLLAEAAKVTIYDAAAIADRMARHAWNLTETIVDENGKIMPGPMFNGSAGARALELVGREHGLFKEKIELGGKIGLQNAELLNQMTKAERDEMRAMLVAASARLPAPANSNQAEETGLVPDRDAG